MYGYSKDEQNKNRLVVDEYAADIVRSIYRRKLEGMSANSIADQLNSEGVLSAGQCAVRNGSAFIPDEAVAGDGSTSNADRRICDFYDSAGGWQRGCVFGTGGSNDSASMVHIRKGET